jgi:hypothetical protein
VQQGLKVERVREHQGKVTQQVRSAITSLDERTGAVALLRPVRGPGGIENRLPYVRDVTFGEDARPVRTGAAPEVLVAQRNTVIGLLRPVGRTNIAAALRHNGWGAGESLRLLGLHLPEN